MVIKYHQSDLLDKIHELLIQNKVLIMPCDTIYGFVGRYPDTDAAIRTIKGRSETKPFLILSTMELLPSISEVRIPEDLRKYWPGPLTLILPDRSGGTTAVRVPDDIVLLDLIKRVGAPIYSTSVNRAGEAPLHRVEDIIAEFEDEVDLIVDGGDITGGQASTIVDITTQPYKVIRQGALYIDRK